MIIKVEMSSCLKITDKSLDCTSIEYYHRRFNTANKVVDTFSSYTIL